MENAFQIHNIALKKQSKMIKNKILIYGAAGYTGKLFTEYALKANLPIVLGTRKTFQTNLTVRIFSLENESAIKTNLDDIKLVVNLAGPFSSTSKKLIEACISSQTHYIDIAGETPEFESTYQFDKIALQSGVMLMPGAGFGVVPTDIVSTLAKEKLPDATHLKISYVTIGGATRGTLKTVLESINKAGIVLENGIYKKATPASKNINIIVEGQTFSLVYNPWRGDLFTAHISTNIKNIETYSNFPNLVIRMMKGKSLWIRDLILNRLINLFPEGPSRKKLIQGKTICHAEVTNEKNEKRTSAITGPEAYVFTVETLTAICKNIMSDNFKPGYQTPSIYKKELLESIPGVKII
jgi:short subunit dehydrogenase-like uncharacterized protein